MKFQAVVGMGFGDEGKGKAVSSLCLDSDNPLVIRFCGGQQAGHHVVLNDKLDHVFSNFGSGTLQGAETYWSEYCTVDPVGIINELNILLAKNIKPILRINKKCPVTTPYEKQYNQAHDKIHNHGSCGVGVGQTYQREQDHYSLLFSDLYFPSILKTKLELLSKYYNFELDCTDFLIACDKLVSSYRIIPTDGLSGLLSYYDRLIFEGSQGLLLDQTYGFFPHVTRANTGIKNIIDMGFTPNVFYVTRAYQTRHGNGHMTNEHIKHDVKKNPYEQNPSNGFQGKFRIAYLDLDLLRYALSRETHPLLPVSKTLVITCLDLMQSYKLTISGKLIEYENENQFVEKIKTSLDISVCFLSKSPFPELYLKN